MFIAHFTEWPWQDEQSGLMGQVTIDLEVSNGLYNPPVATQLYNRYLDEKVAIDEVGFDGIMLNEHHSTPFCMQGVTNVGASILARITKRAKITILGNMIPVWDDPLWIAEQLAMIDVISGGRLVSGWVRGTGRETISHNPNPVSNWERFQEAHDFIIKTWTTPGSFRWEGKHYHFRYVNPWAVPVQKPHPPVWIPGIVSRATVRWAASHGYPYVMLGGDLTKVRECFDFYEEIAKESDWTATPEYLLYSFKCHVDETEELAEQAARKFLGGVSNPFLEGNEGQIKAWRQNPPGLNPRSATNLLPNIHAGRGTPNDISRSFEGQVAAYNIVYGTPKTIVPKIRYIMEKLHVGGLIFWDGDGAMTHQDTMRSIRLFGSEVLPAVRELGKSEGLKGPFDIDPVAGMTPSLVARTSGSASTQ